MKTSEQTTEIFKALAEAQGDFPEIKKNKTVDVIKNGNILYSYEYAELPNIVSEVRPLLKKANLSFTQGISEDGNYLVTRILHSSGQWIETKYPFVARDGDMQGVGGGFTFARRYALSAILGIATETDDDAARADGKDAKIENKNQSSPKPQPPQSPAAKPGQITVEALVTIAEKDLAKNAGFKWSGKKWVKNIDAQELLKNSYPFEIQEVRS